MKYLLAFVLFIFTIQVVPLHGRARLFQILSDQYCSAPKIPMNGTIEFIGPQGPLHESTIKYKCNKGYTLLGPMLNTCKNKKWTQVVPVCRKMNPCLMKNACPYNTKCRSSADGSSHTCQCLPGYSGVSMVGKPIHKCLKNCLQPRTQFEADCLPSLAVYKEGDSITWNCNSGFTEKSDKIAKQKCHYGLWIGHVPSCIGTCPPPSPPEGGVVELFDQDSFVEGNVVRYRCSDGLELVGNEYAICKNHTFGVPPVCRPKSA